MRHNVSGRKLNRTPAHRKMLYRNLVTSLFKHERITTTVPKAKEARILAEKMITFAKRGDLHARRMAARKLNEPAILQKLFEEIGPLDFMQIEPIQKKLFDLTNEYWVSFTYNDYMYDKKYIFVKGSITENNFTLIPFLSRKGVMIR